MILQKHWATYWNINRRWGTNDCYIIYEGMNNYSASKDRSVVWSIAFQKAQQSRRHELVRCWNVYRKQRSSDEWLLHRQLFERNFNLIHVMFKSHFAICLKFAVVSESSLKISIFMTSDSVEHGKCVHSTISTTIFHNKEFIIINKLSTEWWKSFIIQWNII